MKKGFVLLLVLALVAEIVAAVFIVQSQPGGFRSLANVGWGPERRQEIPARLLELNGQAATINITNPSGQVDITADPNLTGVQVNATKIIHGFDDSDFDMIKFNVEQNGNTIKIEGNKNAAPVNFGFGSSVAIRVSLPPALVAGLTTDTGSGDVTVNGIKNDKANLNLKTGSGSITTDGLQTAQLLLNTGSGDIRSNNNSNATSFEARTGSGSIQAETIQASRITLNTNSGDIRASNLNGTLNAHTGSGSIELQGNNVLTNNLSLETGSGDIRLNAQLNLSGDSSIKTGSGSVRLSLMNGSQALGYDINTGSGSIHPNLPNANFANNDKHNVKINGSPVITIRTGSGDVTIN